MLIFIIGLFMSNMAAPLQAKLSTLVQFISKRAATPKPKIKAVQHNSPLSSVFKNGQMFDKRSQNTSRFH